MDNARDKCLPYTCRTILGSLGLKTLSKVLMSLFISIQCLCLFYITVTAVVAVGLLQI